MIIDWSKGAWEALAGGLQRVLLWTGMSEGEVIPVIPGVTSTLVISDELLTFLSLPNFALTTADVTESVVTRLILSEEVGA